MQPEFTSAALGLRVRHHLWESDEEAMRAALTGEPPAVVRHWSDGKRTCRGTSPPSLPPDEEPFDVVIGSDLLYFANQEKPLLATIAHRLSRRRDDTGGPGGVALICQTMRRNNKKVWERFVAAARDVGFNAVDEPCGGGVAGGWRGCRGGDGGQGEALSAEGEAEAAETMETGHAVGYRMLTLTWRPELLLENT